MKVVGFGTVTNTCDALLGSFSSFNKLLRDHRFGEKRVKITWEIVSFEQEQILMGVHDATAWVEASPHELRERGKR